MEAAELSKEREPFDVHEDNWITVQAFKSLQTQWDVVLTAEGRPIWKGLKYESFPAALVMAGAKRKDAREIYLGLQLMEGKAIEVLNEPRESDG